MSFLHFYVVERHSFAPAGSDGQICTSNVRGTARQVSGAWAVSRGFGDPGAVSLTPPLLAEGTSGHRVWDLSLHCDIMGKAGCPHCLQEGSGGKDHSWGSCARQGSLPVKTPGVKVGICSGAGAGVGDRKAVSLQIAEDGRAPLNKGIFFLHMWTGGCWVMVIKGAQMSENSSSHSHEIKTSETKEENCERNAQDDKGSL